MVTLVCAVDLYQRSLVFKGLDRDSDPIICQLQKCLNHTDVNLLMAECWHLYFSPESNAEKFKSLPLSQKEDALQRQMKNLVAQIYEKVLNNNRAFYLDSVYPTRASQLSPLEFLHQEQRFKEAVLDVLTFDDDEAEGDRVRAAIDNNKQAFESTLKDQRLQDRETKGALQGEGTEFVASGVEAFSFMELEGE